MKDPARTLGLAASGAVAAVVLVILWAASRSDGDIGPPEPVPRGVAIGSLLLLPAVVGLIGARRRDRSLLLAAALGSLAEAPLSYGTLPLVIPALLFIAAAAGGSGSIRRRSWLIALAIPLLGAAAVYGLLATSEQRCWVAFPDDGGLVYKVASEAETRQMMGGPGQPVAGGCDGGAFTLSGLGLAGVLAIGAVALALAAPRRSPSASA